MLVVLVDVSPTSHANDISLPHSPHGPVGIGLTQRSVSMLQLTGNLEQPPSLYTHSFSELHM